MVAERNVRTRTIARAARVSAVSGGEPGIRAADDRDDVRQLAGQPRRGRLLVGCFVVKELHRERSGCGAVRSDVGGDQVLT